MSRKQRLRKQRTLEPVEERHLDKQISFKLKTGHVVIFLAGLVLLIYLNSLNNAFLSDDLPTIVNNAHLGDIKEVFTPPLTSISGKLMYWSIFQLFGITPWAFRSLNILFHIGSTVMIFLLVRRLLSERVALISAVLFGVHPLLVESVTWISGSPYSRFSFFLLTSLFFYSKSAEGKWQYWIALLLSALAISTNSLAVVFPAVLCIYEISFGNLRKNWSRIVLFGLVSVIGIIGYAHIAGQRAVALTNDFNEKPQLLNPLIQIPIVVVEYLKLIFLPIGLTLYRSEMSFSQNEYFVHLVLFLLFVGIVFYCWYRNRRVAFFLTFFLVSLLVVLLPTSLHALMAERYVYLATFGITTAAAIGLDWLIAREKTKTPGWLILVLIVTLLAVRTIVRNNDWKNQDNLWTATIKVSPSSPVAHNNMGDVYARHKDFPRAAEEFARAIEIKPNYADAYHNLGNTYLEMGKSDKALESFQQAIKYNPGLWQSYENMALIYLQQKRFDLVIEYLERVPAFSPKEEGDRIAKIIQQIKENELGAVTQ